MQSTLQEALFGLRYMDAAQRSLWKCVGRHQSQAVHPDLVDAVYSLETHRLYTHKERRTGDQQTYYELYLNTKSVSIAVLVLVNA